jgi:hypothetical protein
MTKKKEKERIKCWKCGNESGDKHYDKAKKKMVGITLRKDIAHPNRYLCQHCY